MFISEGGTDVHIMDDCFYDIAIALGLGKHSPYRESIDRKITQLREGGFIEKWMKLGDFKQVKQKPRKDNPFTMGQLQGPFYLFLLGLLASLIDFVWEFAHGKVTK